MKLSQVATDDDDARALFEERVAIMQFDGGLPREIAEGLATLDTMPPPDGFSARRWEEIRAGAAKFADRWGAKALALGWEPVELWGLSPDAPAFRRDARGLAFFLADGDVIALDDAQAVIRMHAGGEQRFRRARDRGPAVMAWELPPSRSASR